MINPLAIATFVLWFSPVFDDKVEIGQKVVDPAGKNRLVLYNTVEVTKNEKEEIHAYDFHSLAWETREGTRWEKKIVISKSDFEKSGPGDRRVNEIHSLDPATGRATIKVAEMSPPDAAGTSQCIYSWREWDLNKNTEVRTIRVCKEPFETLENKSFNLPKAFAKDEPQKVLDEARDLTSAGKYEEALQKYIWFHETSTKKNPSYYGVRLSFALSDWADLAKKYPKARQALVEIRDRDEKKFQEDKAAILLFSDIASINHYLKAEDKTVELFKKLIKERPDTAKWLYSTAEKPLIAQEEYQVCSSFIKDPMQKFQQIKGFHDFARRMGPGGRPIDGMMSDVMDDSLLKDVCDLIRVLAGSGRHEEAEKVRDKALPFLDGPKAETALKKALETKPK